MIDSQAFKSKKSIDAMSHILSGGITIWRTAVLPGRIHSVVAAAAFFARAVRSAGRYGATNPEKRREN